MTNGPQHACNKGQAHTPRTLECTDTQQLQTEDSQTPEGCNMREHINGTTRQPALPLFSALDLPHGRPHSTNTVQTLEEGDAAAGVRGRGTPLFPPFYSVPFPDPKS
ncbi:Hypothetical predicted protein [Pelobates cultripes]|uniref:Uncharacterized protein n=1 Tax=Pelobates cultripes TaxID=61616 RepID=A0AAD1SVW4_PELCU|nr:Hypothetical predicted protein [Pelobates cultripes]